MSLAERLQDDNMKNESALRDVINEICSLTGKSVSKEKADKIVNVIMEDKAPSKLEDLDKYVK